MIMFSFLLFIQISQCLNSKNLVKTVYSLFYQKPEIIIMETISNQNDSDQLEIYELDNTINFNEFLLKKRSVNIINEEIWTNLSYNSTEIVLTQENYTNIIWNISEMYSNFTEGNSISLFANISYSCSTNNSIINSKFYHLYPIEEWKLHKFFKEDYIKLVNSHWFNFPPPSPQMHYLFAAIYFLLMLVGLTGNGLVIFMIVRTSSNILILNLATSDFLMMAKSPVFIYNSLYFGPVFGELGCQLYGFVGGMSGTASIMTLAAISLDRYLVIAHPLNKQRRPTKLIVIIWIIFIWTYSIIFASIPLINWEVKRYVPEGYLTSCSFDYLNEDIKNRWFIFVYFLAAWCLPFVIIMTSYVGIYREVLLVGLARKGQEREKRKRELKLTVIIALVIVMWFISWTPYAIVALLGISGYTNYITPLVSMIPALFCKTAAGINPFIYALNHPRLRQELLKLFCKKRYNFERTQFTFRSWRSVGSRSSYNLKFNEVTQSNRRRSSSTSSQQSVKSIQLMELNTINRTSD